ncbi:MAG TPA: hypothetical protein VGF94_20730 [Kofleriaceae bacterium]|jgi:hypothetical protein
MAAQRETEDAAIARILADYSDPDEPESRLWRDLAKWVFACPRELVDGVSKRAADHALEDAARRVKGLTTAAAWGSAARYFQAENFHDLEGPAAARAVASAKRAARAPKPRSPRKTRRSRARR